MSENVLNILLFNIRYKCYNIHDNHGQNWHLPTTAVVGLNIKHTFRFPLLSFILFPVKLCRMLHIRLEFGEQDCRMRFDRMI